MEMAKASKVEEILKNLTPESSESIIDALNIAENEEKSAMDLYGKEKDKNAGNELEGFFDFMYKEEAMHYTKILELKKDIKEGVTKKIVFEHKTHPILHFSQNGSGEITAVLFALWREKKAIEFYSAAAAKTKENIKDFFMELVKFEQGHAQMLEDYLESMQNTDELIMG